MQQPQYYCYPVAHARAQAQTQAPPAKNDKNSGQHLWLGRTKAQVEEDNVKIAMRESVYRYDPMKPKDPKTDQLFWCVELDGATTLRTFRTIEEDLGPGKWERDPRYGNAFFVRDKEAKK